MSDVASELAKEQCLQVTTYKKDGSAVMTVIWPVPYDEGTFAFITPKQSGKAMRLKRNPRIKMQASDWDGFPLQGTPVVEGTVELVADEEGCKRILGIVLEKYGDDAWDSAMGRAKAYYESKGGYKGDLGVVVKPDRS